MTDTTVQSAFTDMAEMCFPALIGDPKAMKTIRDSFFAGAWFIMQKTREVVLDDDEAAGVAYLSTLAVECDKWQDAKMREADLASQSRSN